MFLNSENKKIVEFLKLKNMYRYADAYLQFLETGKKLDKSITKNLSKSMRSDSLEKFEKTLLKIFLDFEIKIPSMTGKNKNIVSSNFRVKKFREKIKEKGYKNISLVLPAAEYEKLKKLKLSKSMTYSELIIFLINQQNCSRG